MKKAIILAAVALGAIAGPASATVMTIDFAGILLSTTDKTGTVFRNGTADNSGAGTEITGHVTWDLSKPGVFGAHNYFNYFESDFSYSPTSANAFLWQIAVGGNTFSGSLNDGTHNLANLNDREAGAAADLFGVTLQSFGHYQISPEVAGTFDYLSVERTLGFAFTDPSGGTVNGLDFGQAYDWTSGEDGFGTGRFSFLNQIWEDGGPRPYTGTASSILTNSSGQFVLTSLHSSVVPEPATLGLFAIGFAGFLISRRKRLKAEWSVTH